MTEKITRPKAIRKLKDITFEHAAAHIALVSKEQGGGANGHNYTLLMKSRSEDFVQKASQITVTMDIVEYLSRFFHLWSVDAELLARSLGFTTPGMDKAVIEAQEDRIEQGEPPELKWDMEPGDTEFEKYMNYKLQSINVMKRLNTSEDIEAELLKLTEDEMLSLLKDQALVEKSVFKTQVKKQTKKETKDMTIETVEKSLFVDLQKSLVEVQKALDEKQVELNKALETIKQFEDEKKEAIQKARLEELTKAVGDEAKASTIFAGCKDSSDEVFTSVVKTLADVTKNSSLFNETGAASDESEVVTESLVTKAVKARIKTN